jgi:hypothetical protein
MVERVFKLSISLAVLIVVAGIIAAPLVGSAKAFEIAPVYSVARGFWGWVSKSAADSQQPEQNPDSFVNEATAAGDRLSNATAKAAANIPAVQPDPRLSICPVGSIDDTVNELPTTVAETFRRQSEKVKPQTLLDVQGVLNMPHCTIRRDGTTQYRYLVAGGRIVDATVKGEALGVDLQFTNF